MKIEEQNTVMCRLQLAGGGPFTEALRQDKFAATRLMFKTPKNRITPTCLPNKLYLAGVQRFIGPHRVSTESSTRGQDESILFVQKDMAFSKEDWTTPFKFASDNGKDGVMDSCVGVFLSAQNDPKNGIIELRNYTR